MRDILSKTRWRDKRWAEICLACEPFPENIPQKVFNKIWYTHKCFLLFCWCYIWAPVWVSTLGADNIVQLSLTFLPALSQENKCHSQPLCFTFVISNQPVEGHVFSGHGTKRFNPILSRFQEARLTLADITQADQQFSVE